MVLLDGRWKGAFPTKNNLRPTKTPTKPTASNNVQQIYKQYNYLTTNYLLLLTIEQIGDFRAKLDCWTHFSGISLFKMCLKQTFHYKGYGGGVHLSRSTTRRNHFDNEPANAGKK
ncbi:hypothetical protein HMPREF1555_02302 [Porphyromonas gingivalis F0570]|uniref:Uncharacterized protein n=1 Tax=Porphyromonas gingivalis F0570 TaxID=1227271 RepID=A0A0E2LM24_PORGN|nr:hypothetical protein HMPREF1555_02302 [Porphyromonas gingivalis F0570]